MPLTESTITAIRQITGGRGMSQPKKVNYEIIKRQDEDGITHPIYQLMDRLIGSDHTELVEANIALSWDHGVKPDRDGHVMLGQARKTGELERQLHGYDVIIVLNSEWWNDAEVTDRQREALLFHELCHPRPVLDEDNDPKVDENGKIVWYNRKHDVEEFRAVIQKYGLYKADLEDMAADMARARTGENQEERNPNQNQLRDSRRESGPTNEEILDSDEEIDE
jgi:hypothetical protein